MYVRNSLAVQWVGLCAFTAEDPGSNPGQGTKIPQPRKKAKKLCPWAATIEPSSCNYRSLHALEPVLHSKGRLRKKQPMALNWRADSALHS